MEKPIYNYSPYSEQDFFEKCRQHLAANELLPLDFLENFGKTNSVRWYKMLVAVFDGKASGKVHWKYVRKEYELVDSMLNENRWDIYKEHVYEVDEDRGIDTQTVLILNIEDFDGYTFVSDAPSEVEKAVSRFVYDRIYIYKSALDECDKLPEKVYARITPELFDQSRHWSLMKKTIDNEIEERDKKRRYEMKQMEEDSSIHPFLREYKISDTIRHNWYKWYYSSGKCIDDAIQYSFEEPFMCYMYVPYIEWSYKDKSGWVFLNPCNGEIHNSELPLLEKIPVEGNISIAMNIVMGLIAVSTIAVIFFLVAWIFTPIKFLNSMLYMIISAVVCAASLGINKLLDKYNEYKNKQTRLNSGK